MQQEADAYDRKMQAVGQRGREDVGSERPWSRLYVLLRVDREAAWEHVRWLLAELSERGFYKVQFAARLESLPEYSQVELERQWAGRDIYGPVGSLDRKVQCFQATSDEADAVHVAVRIHGSPASYEFGDRSTRNPAELASWLRETARESHRKTLGLVVADGHTCFGEVMAAINSFSAAGLEKIDFAGVEQAPAGVYRMPRLPRPD